MRILAIETASEACSVALFEGDVLLDRRHETIGRGHAERLIPMIAELPDRGRADEIRVSLGPGSFTGTRIGLAAARALGIAWGAKVHGYPTLALVAAVARAERGAIAVDVAMTGGHGEYYVQPFGPDGLPAAPHASLPPAEAAALSTATVIAGTRASQLAEARGSGDALEIWPDAALALALPDALLIEELSPIYGRPPDAKLPGQ